MRRSLRVRLLLTFFALFVVIGGVTLLAIERSFAADLARLAVPADEIDAIRSRMLARLLVGVGFALVVTMGLAIVIVRAVVRPLQSMRRTAERLAAGDYDAPAPLDEGGELGVLARALGHLTREVKTRVGELTQQRDLLSVVVGGLVEGVLVVDRGGAVVLVNDAAKPLVGDGMPEALAPLVARAAAGEGADAELALRGRSVRVAVRPLRAPSKDAAAIAVLYDVTQLQALEAVRREFLANAAHELRTPVTAISGYAETLLGGAVDADTSREFLTTIQRNAQRIAGLVADLLVLDQLGARGAAVAERTPIALADVVADAVRAARGAHAAAAVEPAIEIDVAHGLAVLATRDGLDHVVQNLVDNAVKYGGGGPVEVAAARTGDHVRLAVRDRGAGVPADQAERVFERFVRLEAARARDRGGSGLGLAIVRSQVEAMGGRVWVEDAAPGARFVVELDAA